MTWEQDPAHNAVELENVSLLRDLLDAGADVEGDAGDGFTLLMHALDIEADSRDQGRSLHVDVTALLISRGADLERKYNGISALEEARVRGHWLAVELMESWLGRNASGKLFPFPAACRMAVSRTGEPATGSTQPGGGHDHGGSESGSPDSTPAPPPPPVDYDKVRMIDAKPGALAPPRSDRSASSGPGGGFSMAPPQPEKNLRIGKRGEEIVYNKERQRLQALGMNPDSVTWVSKTNETSPYDIRSLDEDAQVIYIEVKSTKAADPNGQFWISRAEVELARSKRGRYYIYRVTDADTDAPTIRRVPDLLGLVLEGKGRVMLSQARVELSFDSSEGAPADDPLPDQTQSY